MKQVRVSGSHGGEYENDCRPCCCAVYSGGLRTFRRFRAIALMEEVITSETSVNLYQTTQRNTTEDNHLRKLNSLNCLKSDVLACDSSFVSTLLLITLSCDDAAEGMKREINCAYVGSLEMARNVKKFHLVLWLIYFRFAWNAVDWNMSIFMVVFERLYWYFRFRCYKVSPETWP
jgi:hypothetical protein